MALTPRQSEILELIRSRQRRAGPSIREVAKEAGVRGYAIQRAVSKLRAAGELEGESGNGLVVRTQNEGAVAQMHTRAPILKPGGKLV
jgi:DNA-binding transcriptional regulator YhcF (GntR family)